MRCCPIPRGLPRWTDNPKLHHETIWPSVLSRPLRRLSQRNGIFSGHRRNARISRCNESRDANVRQLEPDRHLSPSARVATTGVQRRRQPLSVHAFLNTSAFIATHSNSIDERPFDRKVTSALTTTRLNAPQALSLRSTSDRLDGCGQSERRAPKSVLLLSSAALWNAASRDFFGSERRTNTTRWTPGPAIPAVAPKQGANRDDHSKQRGLNRPRHDECGLRMTMP